jgi:hypothetical protein
MSRSSGFPFYEFGNIARGLLGVFPSLFGFSPQKVAHFRSGFRREKHPNHDACPETNQKVERVIRSD